MWVIDRLQSPPSWARALDKPCRLSALPLTLLLLVSRVPPAALPPAPIAESVPEGPLVAAPRPSVDAEMPAAAALPPVPPAADAPAGFAGDAAWETPKDAATAITAAKKQAARFAHGNAAP